MRALTGIALACKGDLLYLLHIVPERKFEVIGGDAAETIVSEDEAAEIQVVSSHPLNGLSGLSVLSECFMRMLESTCHSDFALSSYTQCMSSSLKTSNCLSFADNLQGSSYDGHALLCQGYVASFRLSTATMLRGSSLYRCGVVSEQRALQHTSPLLLMQVEDAKDFIKTRILSLIDQKQTPHKVGAAEVLQAKKSKVCLCKWQA